MSLPTPRGCPGTGGQIHKKTTLDEDVGVLVSHADAGDMTIIYV